MDDSMALGERSTHDRGARVAPVAYARVEDATSAQARRDPAALVMGVSESPGWARFREDELANWLNLFLSRLWPFVNRSVCALVRAQVEPLLDHRYYAARLAEGMRQLAAAVAEASHARVEAAAELGGGSAMSDQSSAAAEETEERRALERS